MSNLAKTLSRAALRWRHNSFEQYMSIYKTPLNPKIAIYGAYNQLFAQLLSKHFTNYRTVNIQELGENSNDLIDNVAQNIVSVDEQFNDGHFLTDFPRNVEQAARLDLLLDGINLAINIKLPENATSNLSGKYLECRTCGQVFNTALESTVPHLPGTGERCNTPTKCDIVESSKDLASNAGSYTSNYKDVLEYYEKRGLLLNFVVNEKWTFEETINHLGDEILGHIKL